MISVFFFSSRRRHTRWPRDWSSDVCSSDLLYVLASGRAKAVHLSAAGDEHVVDLLAPGDLFGGLALLGTLEHHETVRAMTTMCALPVDTAAFRQILLHHPQVAMRAPKSTARPP